jgi:hypothetical protein
MMQDKGNIGAAKPLALASDSNGGSTHECGQILLTQFYCLQRLDSNARAYLNQHPVLSNVCFHHNHLALNPRYVASSWQKGQTDTTSTKCLMQLSWLEYVKPGKQLLPCMTGKTLL